jgi:hypothetical protein
MSADIIRLFGTAEDFERMTRNALRSIAPMVGDVVTSYRDDPAGDRWVMLYAALMAVLRCR